MAKKKDNISSMMMGETLTYGTAGILSANISSLTGDATAMRVFNIGSSLAGIPSLSCASKKIFDVMKGW
jgi:hypothetical protein